MRARERLAVQSIERKQHVTRNDELRVSIASRGVGCERIISRQVCVHDFDLVPANEARQLVRALYVERVAQRQSFYLGRWESNLIDQRRPWTKGNVNIVTTLTKTVGQIGDVSLTAAERCR